MSEAGRHIIGRNELNIAVHGNADGEAVQRSVNKFYDRLIPALEAVLDRYDQLSQVIVFDSIKIDVNDLSEYEIEYGITDRIVQAFEKQIMERMPAEVVRAQQNAVSKKLTTIERIAEAWVFFLHHGYLPWWMELPDRKVQESVNVIQHALDRFEQQDLPAMLNGSINEKFSADVLQLLADEAATVRLLLRLKEETVWQLIFALGPGKKNETASLRNDLGLFLEKASAPYPSDFRFGIMKRLLHSLSKGNIDLSQEWAVLISEHILPEIPSDEIILPEQLQLDISRTILRQRIAETSLKKESSWPKNPAGIKVESKKNEVLRKKGPTLSETASIYLNNAGMIIIAPYLSMFFSGVGIADKKAIIDPDKAITLLHYITTGATEFEEYEVPLFKILCGLNMADVSIPTALTQEEKEQAEALLGSVIENWPALKSTSVEGLRQSFLLREGKLSQEKNNWQLKVQPQSYDMLLYQLPWSIGMIRLPWMDRLIKTEWM